MVRMHYSKSLILIFLRSYSNFSCSIETNVNCKQGRPFTVSSNKCKAWAKEGAELLGDFMVSKGEYNNL
jgi:hypothetical protein